MLGNRQTCPSKMDTKVQRVGLSLLLMVQLAAAHECSDSFGLSPDQTDPTCGKYFTCAFGYPFAHSRCGEAKTFSAHDLKCVHGPCWAKSHSTASRVNPEANTGFDPSVACPHQAKIICYFPNWSNGRSGIGKYTVENVDFSLCTHVTYAFVEVSPDFNIVPNWDQDHLDPSAFLAFTNMKARHPEVKFSVGVGGWVHSQANKELYKKLFDDENSRAQFAKSVMQFLRQYSFDGLDMVYLHPDEHDRLGYEALMHKLHVQFAKRGYELSATISGVLGDLRKGFNFSNLSPFMDYYNVIGYDLHGFWDQRADHHSPLHKRPWDEAGPEVETTVKYLLDHHVPSQKIVIGLPTFGRSFRVKGDKFDPPIERGTGEAALGQWTREASYLSYYEICLNILEDGWHFEDKANAPYAFKGDQWVGFDSQMSIREKALFALRNGLGGAMLWNLADDDFDNQCGQGSYPLLSTVNAVFRRPPCFQDGNIPPEVKPTSCNQDKKIICYYTSRSSGRSGIAQFRLSSFDPSNCTHLVYAFIYSGETFGVSGHLALDQGTRPFHNFTDFLALRANHPQVKYLASVGGLDSSQRHKAIYQSLMADRDHRLQFTNAVINFLHQHKFDGLNLDYQTPTREEKPGYCDLVRVLKKELSLIDLELTIAVPVDRDQIRMGYDIPCISDNVDALIALTYAYHKSDEATTGHLASLDNHPQDTTKDDVRSSLQFLRDLGASPQKLIMAVPAFGTSFTTKAQASGIGDAVEGPGAPGSLLNEHGVQSHPEIMCSNIGRGDWHQGGTIVHGPFAYKGNQFVSFDNTSSLARKVEYVAQEGLGGVMLYEISFDDFHNDCRQGKHPLLAAIHSNLCHP